MPESIPPSRHESGARTLHSARLMEFSELNPEPRCRIAPNCRPTRFSPTSILSKTPPRFSSNPSTSKTHASAPLFRPSSLLVAESLCAGGWCGPASLCKLFYRFIDGVVGQRPEQAGRMVSKRGLKRGWVLRRSRRCARCCVRDPGDCRADCLARCMSDGNDECYTEPVRN